MNKIGFSHGVLYRVMPVYTKEAFLIYENAGSEIIEICFAKAGEIKKLNDVIPFVEKYRYKSIHLPTDIRYGDDNATRILLDKVSEFYNSIGAELILVHPDLVDDWSVFDDYPLNWAIENMDNRKQSYQYSDSLKRFFGQRPDWKMVLDLNHCYSNDSSMKLAEEFTNEFKDRIVEIHLSGFIDYHEPLFETKQTKIIDFCKKLDVPIIIESTFDSVDDVKQEIPYIKDYLEQ